MFEQLEILLGGDFEVEVLCEVDILEGQVPIDSGVCEDFLLFGLEFLGCFLHLFYLLFLVGLDPLLSAVCVFRLGLGISDEH